MATTLLADLINPEVMADMINASLPNAIRFSGIATIDNTLQGQPGNTITVPKYEYIGDALEIAEGAAVDYSKLTTKDAQHKIKKVGKGVELTDEAVLSGYGNPVGQATKQITMSIASKVDMDIVEEALKAPLAISRAIDLDMIDAAEAVFNDEDGSVGVLFLNSKDASKLRKMASDNWTRGSALGDTILASGAYGEVLGWQVVRTNKLSEGTAIFVKANAADALAEEDTVAAITIYLKRGVLAESARDIDHKLTKFNADQHYVVAVTDDTKIVVVKPATP